MYIKVRLTLGRNRGDFSEAQVQSLIRKLCGWQNGALIQNQDIIFTRHHGPRVLPGVKGQSRVKQKVVLFQEEVVAIQILSRNIRWFLSSKNVILKQTKS